MYADDGNNRPGKSERKSLQQQGRRQNKGRSGERGRRRLHSAHRVNSVMDTNDYLIFTKENQTFPVREDTT